MNAAHTEERVPHKWCAQMKSARSWCCSGRGLEQQFGTRVSWQVGKVPEKDFFFHKGDNYLTSCGVCDSLQCE